MRWLAAFSLVLAQSVFAQLSPGVTRFPYPDDGPVRDPQHMIAGPDNLLWVASATEGVVDEIAVGRSARRFDLPFWGGAWDMTLGPDGALWIAARHYVARLVPATGSIASWQDFRRVYPILAGPDGNIWFVQRDDRYNRPVGPLVVRMSTDGRVLNTFEAGGAVSGAVFASDGALWISTLNAGTAKLVRITTGGARSEYPADQAGTLYSGPGFLWIAASGAIQRVNLLGRFLGTYRVAMRLMDVDAAGNLWLRTSSDSGEQVAQLTPSGRLTRFGPLPALPRDECVWSEYGGFAALGDGRMAMADFYPIVGWRPEDPCAMNQRSWRGENTLTILDPAVAPVLSVEQLNVAPRRRITRH